MYHLFSNFPLSYMCRTCDEEKPQSGRPHQTPQLTAQEIGRGSLSSKSPEACLGAGNPERGEWSRTRPVVRPEAGERAGVHRLGGSLRPRPRPDRGVKKDFQHPPSFNSRLLRGRVCPSPCTPACNVAASGTPSDPEGHPNSSLLSPGRAVFQAPLAAGSPLRGPGKPPSSRAPTTPAEPLPCAEP